MSASPAGRVPEPDRATRCEICGQPALRRVSGGKFWCMHCGHLQS